jgi:hypothetical protein
MKEETMKMRKNLSAGLLSGLLIFLGASAAQAGTAKDVNGTISATTVGWSGEGYYFSLKNVSDTSGCSGPMYFISVNHPAYKTLVAQVMLAMTLKSQVSVHIDGTCPSNSANAVGIYMAN